MMVNFLHNHKSMEPPHNITFIYIRYQIYNMRSPIKTSVKENDSVLDFEKIKRSNGGTVTFNGRTIPLIERSMKPEYTADRKTLPDIFVFDLPPEPEIIPEISLSEIYKKIVIVCDSYSKDEAKRSRARNVYKEVEKMWRLSKGYISRLDALGISKDCYYSIKYSHDKSLFEWIFNSFEVVKSRIKSVKRRERLNIEDYKRELEVWEKLYKPYDKTNPVTKIIGTLATTILLGTATINIAKDQAIQLFDKLTNGTAGTLSYVGAVIVGGLLLALSNFLVRFAIAAQKHIMYRIFHLKVCFTRKNELLWIKKLSTIITHRAVIRYAKAGYWRDVIEYMMGNANLREGQKKRLLRYLRDKYENEKEYYKALIKLSKYVNKSLRRTWTFSDRFKLWILETFG